MAKSKSKIPQVSLPNGDESAWLLETAHRAVYDFAGTLETLESAIGFMFVGHYYGWKVLYLVHSKKTVRNYEELLGIQIREVFPEVGPYAERSNAWRLASGISNFWKVVSGEIKVEGDRKVTSGPDV